MVSFCALCFMMSCSRNKNVRLWETFWRTCTSAFHVFLAASLVQSGHWPCWTRYSISNVCSRIVFVRTFKTLKNSSYRVSRSRKRTSFWIVRETLSLFECGSVQMKWASVNRTLLSPFSLLRHMESSSDDSSCASVHVWGGERNRSQFRQKDTDAYSENLWESSNIRIILSPTLLWDAFCDINSENRQIKHDCVQWYRSTDRFSSHIAQAPNTHVGRIWHDEYPWANRLRGRKGDNFSSAPQSAQSTRWTGVEGTNSIFLVNSETMGVYCRRCFESKALLD